MVNLKRKRERKKLKIFKNILQLIILSNQFVVRILENIYIYIYRYIIVPTNNLRKNKKHFNTQLLTGRKFIKGHLSSLIIYHVGFSLPPFFIIP